MINKEKNLNNIVSKTATKWKTRAKLDRSKRRSISRAQLFALELLDYMDENGIKQNELAKKMGVSAQQINKIVRAKSNLTFETLDKIEKALGIVITNPQIETQRNAHSSIIRNKMEVVYNKNKNINVNISSETKIHKNPILTTSILNMDTYFYTARQI